MDKNFQKITAVGSNHKKIDGFWMECGHFQKMPNGIKQDISNPIFWKWFQKIKTGNGFTYCQTCARINKKIAP
jgi:hypothetical protein